MCNDTKKKIDKTIPCTTKIFLIKIDSGLAMISSIFFIGKGKKYNKQC